MTAGYIKSLLKPYFPRWLRRLLRNLLISVTPERELFPPKINPQFARTEYNRLNKEHPDSDIVLLLDDYVKVDSLPQVNCNSEEVSALARYDFKKTIFLYACDSDEIGLPFIRKIVEQGGKFYPVAEIQPSLYVNINDVARRVLEAEYIYQKSHGFAKWDAGPYDFINIIQAIDICVSLDGDYLEIGCFRGSSSCVALRYMKKIGLKKKCYFFDVFDGFDYQAAQDSADLIWAGGHKTEGLEIVRERLLKHEDKENGPTVIVYKNNIIEDDLPKEIRSIAVANIDVDLYEAVKVGLEKVAPRILPGGIMIAEDAGHTPFLIGARLALSEFLETDSGKQFTPIYLQSGQTFLIKKYAS